MQLLQSIHVLLGLLTVHRALAEIKKFTIDLEPCRLLQLVDQTHLPAVEEYPGLGDSLGIDLKVLKSMQTEWTTTFDWATEQADLNQYHHYTTIIEGLTIHFIHHKSSDPNAIPLILSHGWPGSFMEFLPVIDPLTTASSTSNRTSTSFHVVVPSLPGYAFSSAPPVNWTLSDTARVFNTLMTDVLGYETYAAHGTDFGSNVAYNLYNNFNTSVRAVHLVGIPFLPLSPDEFPKYNITLDADEEFQENLVLGFSSGYDIEQSTKPNTIGLALYDNPVGQLAWMAEKYISSEISEGSDPQAGTPPSVLTHNEILREVSLYFLTKSFVSSAFTYAQNPDAYSSSYTKAQTDAPMLFSSFKYSGAFWTEEVISWVGNLVTTKTINDMLAPHIQARLAKEPETGDRKTVVDLCLQHIPAGSNEKKAAKARLEYIELVLSQVQVFILAGHHTTAQAICWVLYEIHKYPDVLRQLRSEHDQVLGSNHEQAADILSKQPHKLKALHYTQAAIKETLRVHALGQTHREGSSGVNFLIDNAVYPTEDTIIQTIPNAPQTRPDLWPRVKEFLPERFPVAKGHARCPPKNTWRPSSWEAQDALAKKLAMMEIKLVPVLALRDLELDFDSEGWNKLRCVEVALGFSSSLFAGWQDDSSGSSSYDGTIRAWDTTTGATLHTREDHSDVVSSGAFESSCISNHWIREYVNGEMRNILWLPPDDRPTMESRDLQRNCSVSGFISAYDFPGTGV
ncbi:hypothetical protein NHQ30_010683 [Ciborinia camelliae]|nr:hypothetical protein NHQ30_010683 [Ciborinia camelliae]